MLYSISNEIGHISHQFCIYIFFTLPGKLFLSGLLYTVCVKWLDCICSFRVSTNSKVDELAQHEARKTKNTNCTAVHGSYMICILATWNPMQSHNRSHLPSPGLLIQFENDDVVLNDKSNLSTRDRILLLFPPSFSFSFSHFCLKVTPICFVSIAYHKGYIGIHLARLNL